MFKRLRLAAKFKSGKDVLPVLQHCRVVGHTKTLPLKPHVTSQATRNKPFGIGDPESTTEDATTTNTSLFSADASRTGTPALGLSSESPEIPQEDDQEYPTVSKMSRKLPTKPVISLDPSVATVLSNGDLLYRLTTRVNLAERFIGSSITMAVEVTLKEEPMDVSSLFTQLILRDTSAPSLMLTAYTMFSLVDPLKVRLLLHPTSCSTLYRWPWQCAM